MLVARFSPFAQGEHRDSLGASRSVYPARPTRLLHHRDIRPRVKRPAPVTRPDPGTRISIASRMANTLGSRSSVGRLELPSNGSTVGHEAELRLSQDKGHGPIALCRNGSHHSAGHVVAHRARDCRIEVAVVRVTWGCLGVDMRYQGAARPRVRVLHSGSRPTVRGDRINTGQEAEAGSPSLA